MIQISQAAAREILRLGAKRPASVPLFFRVGVESKGCCGLSYLLNFDQSVEPDDQLYATDKIQVVIKTQDLQYLQGLTLDYSEDLMGGGFRFHNPNAVQSCSCGHSFTVESSS